MNANTADFSDYDPQSQTELSKMKFLNFETVQKGGSGKDPFEGIRTNKSFEEISKENAKKNPLGENSIFNEIEPKDFKPTKLL